MIHSKPAKVFTIVSLVFAVTTGLQGCREEEQNRPMSYKKGVYGGKPDQKLTEEQRKALRQRGAFQRVEGR